MFSIINLEPLIVLHYSFRGWDFRLINLESVAVLAYSFRDSKYFALLIWDSKSSGLFL